MNSINMNQEFPNMNLHSLSEEKRMTFLNMSADMLIIKKKSLMFTMKFLNF